MRGFSAPSSTDSPEFIEFGGSSFDLQMVALVAFPLFYFLAVRSLQEFASGKVKRLPSGEVFGEVDASLLLSGELVRLVGVEEHDSASANNSFSEGHQRCFFLLLVFVNTLGASCSNATTTGATFCILAPLRVKLWP